MPWEEAVELSEKEVLMVSLEAGELRRLRGFLR